MKKIAFILFVTILFSCSKDSNTITETVYVEIPTEIPDLITGTVRYVVDTDRDEMFLFYINENKEEKSVYVNSKHWEYSFTATQGDLVYVTASIYKTVSNIDIVIYFNNIRIKDGSCTSNTFNSCHAITKIP